MADIIKTIITVRTSVNAPVETVWKHWTSPESITKWNNASDDWHTPKQAMISGRMVNSVTGWKPGTKALVSISKVYI